MKIIEGNFRNKDNDLAPGFSHILRELADAVDAGEVNAAAVIVTRKNQFELHMPSSLHETLVLATLLHRRAVDGFILG
jgi:hypothetical protein